MTEGETVGWFWPSNARKALCDKWMRVNPFTGRGAPIQGGIESPPSSDDCVTCRRKVDKMLEE